MGALHATVMAESGLGALQARIASDLGGAEAHTADARDLCADSVGRSAGRRLRRAERSIRRAARRLDGPYAQRRVTALVREPLLTALQPIAQDIRSLSEILDCPAAAL
jgi:hypothetical protein